MNKPHSETALSICWQRVRLQPPGYLFKHYDDQIAAEYRGYRSLAEIFDLSSSGFESGKDRLMIDFEREPLARRIKKFCQASASEAAAAFNIDNGWGRTILNKRASILSDEQFHNRIQTILFRPFDERYTFYRKDLLKTNSYRAGQHLKNGNIALIAMRQVSIDAPFSHIFVTSLMPNNRAFYSTRGKICYFPLYQISEKNCRQQSNADALENGSVANLKPNFLNEFANCAGLKSERYGNGDLIDTFGPRDLFNYIYAICHSTIYRQRYQEMLKFELPCVPLCADRVVLKRLCDIGNSLVELHLLRSSIPMSGSIEFFAGKSIKIADHFPKFAGERIYINQASWFAPVTEAVWQYAIGGYQICLHWLLARRGRQLTTDEARYFIKVIAVLDHTCELSQQIDKAVSECGLFNLNR